jgi:hypothetical protein
MTESWIGNDTCLELTNSIDMGMMKSTCVQMAAGRWSTSFVSFVHMCWQAEL